MYRQCFSLSYFWIEYLFFSKDYSDCLLGWFEHVFFMLVFSDFCRMSTSTSAKLFLTRFITHCDFSLCGFTISSIRRHWRLEYCSNSSYLILTSFCSFEQCFLRTSTLFYNIDTVEFCSVSFSLRFSIYLFS